MPPALFALAILEIGSRFILPIATEMTVAHHFTQLLAIEIGSCKLFSLCSPQIMILPISVFQEAKVAGMTYECPAYSDYF
jgi:hypothetical protein